MSCTSTLIKLVYISSESQWRYRTYLRRCGQASEVSNPTVANTVGSTIDALAINGKSDTLEDLQTKTQALDLRHWERRD